MTQIVSDQPGPHGCRHGNDCQDRHNLPLTNALSACLKLLLMALSPCLSRSNPMGVYRLLVGLCE